MQTNIGLQDSQLVFIRIKPPNFATNKVEKLVCIHSLKHISSASINKGNKNNEDTMVIRNSPLYNCQNIILNFF